MDASLLDRFRTTLDQMREDLRAQLADLGADPDDDTVQAEFDAGFADSAHATAELGRVLALIERLRAQLTDVDRAIAKMDAGTYGVCDNCGQDIAIERLEVLPYSTLCVSCKQREAV